MLNNSDDGIDLDFSFNNTLKNNTVTANKYNGICFDDSDGNVIANNNVFNNSDDGIDLEGSFDNMLINNTVYLNTYEGIQLKNSSNNNIRNNIIYPNGVAGIYLSRPGGAEPIVGGSSYNIITSNDIYSNDGCGIDVDVYKTDWLNTSDTYIDHNQTYNFDIGWIMDFWKVKNLDNVTITLTTLIDIALYRHLGII